MDAEIRDVGWSSSPQCLAVPKEQLKSGGCALTAHKHSEALRINYKNGFDFLQSF